MHFFNAVVSFLEVAAAAVGKTLELGDTADEGELDGAGRAVTLLADDDLGNAGLLADLLGVVTRRGKTFSIQLLILQSLGPGFDCNALGDSVFACNYHYSADGKQGWGYAV